MKPILRLGLSCRPPGLLLKPTDSFKLMLLLALISYGISGLISSVPIKDFYPEQMEAGGKVLQKHLLTGQDQDATTKFEYRYTVNLLRVHNLGGFRVCVGYKGMDVDFPVEPAVGLQLCLVYQDITATGFDVFLKVSQENSWNFFRSSYIAISNSMGNVYQFYHLCALNREITGGATWFFYDTDTSIQPLSAGNYFVLVSIYMFDPVYQKSAITNREVKVVVTPTSFTTYTIGVSATGLYIGDLSIVGLLLDPALINNPNLPYVIMITDSVYSGSNAQQTTTVVQYPGIQFWYQHAFFGLYYLSHLTKPNYDFFVYPTGKIQLIKEAESLAISTYILVFYKQKCTPPTFLDTKTGKCTLCPDQCNDCNQTQCLSCLNGFTVSTDKKTCVCPFSSVVNDVCYDFTTGPLKGCVLAVKNSSQVNCMACSMPMSLVSKNYECTCKDGFKFDANGNCFEYCGDGLIENHQCDDGNLVDGDGCSSTCTLQSGFKCTVTGTTTKCKSELYLIFNLLSIMKNEDNSADMTFGVYQNSIPHDLKKQNFEILGDIKKRYSIKLEMQNNDVFEVNAVLQSVSSNKLKFRVEYNFTIQGMNAKLYLDMSNSEYAMSEINYSFKTIGDNEPLKFNGKMQLFISAQRGYLGMSVVYILILLIGLIAPKYIGLQAILTLQLIYYSCLLVIDTEKIPVGFNSFKLLKMSTGYNDFFAETTLLLNSDLVSKLNYIGIKKLIIENYNTSFVLIFVSALAFGISSFIRNHQQNTLILLKQSKQPIHKNELNQLQQKFTFHLKINEYLFRAFNQISVWSILQIMCAISAQLTISAKSFILNKKTPLILVGTLFWIVGGFLILIMGLNFFKNTMLSLLTMQKLLQRPSEHAYKQIKFIYLIIVGSIIFFFHQMKVWMIYPSVVVALVHISYMGILWRIKPYQKSLHVHSVGLFINQLIYLIFLVFVNIINYLQEIEQIISVAFVYFIMLLCVIVVLLTIVRLYYEYRYGQKLQIQIQKKREEEQRRQKVKEKQILHRKTKALEQQAKQRLDQRIKKRLNNKYLFQNQVIEMQMNDLIEFWDKRPNLKQEQKENEYFKKYSKKPLQWLKTNEPQEYQKRLLEQQKIKMLQREKVNSKYDDPQYQRVSARLRKQFARKTKKERASKKKKPSRQ